MFISKFNHFLEKHGRLTILAVGVIVVIPFLFMWGPGSDLMGRRTTRRGDVGRVLGEPVSSEQFLHQVLALDIQFMQQYGHQDDRWLHEIPEFRDVVAEQAINRLLLLGEARRRNLDYVSDEEIADRLFEMFSADGRFEDEFYQWFIFQTGRKLGLREDDFVLAIRDNIIIDRVTRQINSGIFVSLFEAKQEALKLYQKFDVEISRFAGNDYMEEVDLDLTAEELSAYYEQNTGPFRVYADAGVTPNELRMAIRRGQFDELPPSPLNELAPEEFERRTVEFYEPYYIPPRKRVIVALFPLEKFIPEVSDIDENELRAYYENNIAEYIIDSEPDEDDEAEAPDTPVYQPFEEVSEDIKAEVVREKANAMAFAAADEFAYQAYMKAIDIPDPGEARTAFRELTEEADVNYRETDWFGRQDPVAQLENDTRITSRAFEVSEVRPVSGVIEGDENYYVAQWVDTQPGHLQPFDPESEIRERIEAQIKRHESIEIARSKAEAAHTAIADALVRDGMSFEDIRETWDFEDIPEFSRRAPPSVPQAHTIVLTAEELADETLSEPVNIPGGAILVYLKRREPPADEELNNLAEEEVRPALWQRKQHAAMQEINRKLQLDGGTHLDADLIRSVFSR